MAAEEALRRRGSSGQSSYGGSSGTAVRENPVMRSFFGGGGDKSARGTPSCYTRMDASKGRNIDCTL